MAVCEVRSKNSEETAREANEEFMSGMTQMPDVDLNDVNETISRVADGDNDMITDSVTVLANA